MLTNVNGTINIDGEWKHEHFKLKGPATFTFELKDDQLEIMFEEPLPVATYRFVSADVPYIRMNLEHVVLGLKNLPDITLEVE
jgi:hypothetical protein